MKRRENAGWGLHINPGISQAGLLKNHQISQYPQSDCEGWWPFGSERIFFSVLSPLTLSSGIFLPFHMWPSFSGSGVYCVYCILGNLVFQGTPLSPAPFSAALTRGRIAFSAALLSYLFPYSFGGLLKSVLYLPPSAINCFSLMLCSSLIAPRAPPLQGQTLGRTCTPLKPSIAS